MRIRCLAPAKLNLCLFLGPTRDDGRHELVTLFQALSLADELTLEVDGNGPDRVLCPGVEGENLAARALAALRVSGWGGPPVTVTIEKRIPVAAGMAGGSADAAAALRLAIALTGPAHPRPEELDAIAASLGADVPSQLSPGLAVGTGAGEQVVPLPPLAEHAFVVVPSDRELPTPAVFREADRLGLPRPGDDLAARYRALVAALGRPGARLPAELLVNDLEPAAISLCPSVGTALAAVRAAGAEVTLVCGSGPTVAGLWWGAGARDRAREAADLLRREHPRTVAADPVTAEFAAAIPV